MADYLLGLDYGTGGAKAAIVDGADGKVVSYSFEEYPILTPKPAWSEHDARNYWSVACRLISKVLADGAVSASQIRGVAVSSALPSLVLVGRDHAPLANAYNLMDRRAVEQVRELKERIGEDRIFEISKNRLDDHPSIVNLLWEKRNRPEVFAKLWKALTIDGFVTLLSELGLKLDIFPDLYPCDAIVGTVTAQAAAETGLAEGTPVAAGQVDCNAGWVGAGAVEDGDIQMNLGTCGNFGIIHSAPIFHRSMIVFNYTTDSRNVFITVPTTTTGGGLIRYMRDNFYKAEMGKEAKDGSNVYDLIDREAESAPPGAEGLVALPFLMGERTPIWDVNARGTIFGLSMHHTRGHVIRAMMESVAFALYDSFRLIAATGQKINAPIVLNEGGAKSVLWRRIITDVFDVPTVLVGRRTGAPAH